MADRHHTTDQQAEPGLPAFDRRNFVATLAAAGVMTASATSFADSVSAEPLAETQHLDAELLKHVAQHVEHTALQQAYDAQADTAMDRYVSPPIPKALHYRKRDFLSVCFDLRRLTEYRIDGVEVRIYEDQASLGAARQFLAAYRSNPEGFPYRENDVARAEELLAAMAVWEADIRRAEDEAGLTEPTLAAKREENILAGLRRAIALTPARTIEGLAAKAMIAKDVCTWGSENPASIRNMLKLVVDRSNDVDWREAMGMSLAIDAADVLSPSSERSAA